MLDQMAREGLRFTDFYASPPMSARRSPRAGLLTGRYAIRSGLAHEVIQPSDTIGLPLSEVTIPKALKGVYASALITPASGTWGTWPFRPPTAYGFDRFVGLPYSHDMRPLSLFEADSTA